jgi:hypothetical protein
LQINDRIGANAPRLDRPADDVRSGGTGAQAWRLETWVNQDGSYAIRDTRQGGNYQRLAYADANGNRGEFYLRQNASGEMANADLDGGGYRIIAPSRGYGNGQSGGFRPNQQLTVSPNGDRDNRTLPSESSDATIARLRGIIGPRPELTRDGAAAAPALRDGVPDTPDITRAPDRVLRGGTGAQAWQTEMWNNADGSFAIRDTRQNGQFQRLNYADANGNRGEIYLRQLPTGERMVNADLGDGRYQVDANSLGWGTGKPGAFKPNTILTVNPNNTRSETALPTAQMNALLDRYTQMINGSRRSIRP